MLFYNISIENLKNLYNNEFESIEIKSLVEEKNYFYKICRYKKAPYGAFKILFLINKFGDLEL